MDTIKTVGELVDFIKFKTKLTQQKIALKADYTRSYLSDAVTNNSFSVFKKLKLTFSDILIETDLQYTKIEKEENSGSEANEHSSTYIKHRRHLKTTKQDTLMYYKIGAHAGATAEILPVKKNEGQLHISDLFRGSEFAIRISGNSMTPNYPPGATIGIREVQDKMIIPGSVYVVETENDLWIKRLFYKNNDQSTGEFECLSDNTMKFENGPYQGNYCYPVFRVEIDNVRRLFKVTGIYKPNELTLIER